MKMKNTKAGQRKNGGLHMFKQIEGGVTAAKGFSAASTAAGIKYKDRKDMAMVYSSVPCTVAGTFTTNVVKAAPVLWDKMIADEKKTAQVVVINAGIANACTGEIGYSYCEQTAKAAEEALNIPYDKIELSNDISSTKIRNKIIELIITSKINKID